MTAVNRALHVNCLKSWMNTTHSTGFHKEWNAARANFILSDTHPYSREKCTFVGIAAVLKTLTKPPTPKPTSTPDTITFSRAEVGSKIAHIECNSMDPNTSDVAVMMRSVFLNQRDDLVLVKLCPLCF